MCFSESMINLVMILFLKIQFFWINEIIFLLENMLIFLNQ